MQIDDRGRVELVERRNLSTVFPEFTLEPNFAPQLSVCSIVNGDLWSVWRFTDQDNRLDILNIKEVVLCHKQLTQSIEQ